MIKQMRNHRNTRLNILTVVTIISLVFVVTLINCVPCPTSIKITDGIYDYSSPKFSPDGEKILYVSNESDDGYWQIWVMNTDGTNRLQLTTEQKNHSSPSYSPDGEKITYAKESDDGGTRVWIMGADGMNQIQISDQFGGYPSFCFDGRSIVYSKGGSIWMMDSHGNNQSLIPISGGRLSHIFDPEVSPDGKWIIFYSISELTGYVPSYHVDIVTVDGSNYTNLTAIGPYGEEGRYPTFSPEGENILYTSFGDLWLVDIDGSNKTLLLDTDGQITHPSISPDGKKIVYVEDGDIWIYNLEENGSTMWLLYSVIYVLVVVVLGGLAYYLKRKKVENQ